MSGYGSKTMENSLKALNTLNTRQQERTGGADMGSSDSICFDENQLLAVTLSTIASLADGEVQEKRCYMTSRIFLENLTDQNGQMLSNARGLLKEMDEFQQKHYILDTSYRIDEISDNLNEIKIDDDILMEQSMAEVRQDEKRELLKLPPNEVLSSTPMKKNVEFDAGDVSSIIINPADEPEKDQTEDPDLLVDI